jgi:hypothetical protein
MKNFIALFLLACLFHVPQAWAQCAPGIPDAGNPECLPPDDANSPYYQGDRNKPGETRPQQPRAVWADRWGAIAEDPQASAVGTVIQQESKSKAEEAALSSCTEHGGRNCKIALTYYNQCAAVAVDEENLAVHAHAATQEKAEQLALNGFNGGHTTKIVYSACSLPVRVQ